MTHIKQIAKGTKQRGETWTNWWLFNRLTKEQLEYVLEVNYIGYSYNGPGQPYTSSPIIVNSKTRTLVMEDGGLDI